MNDVTNYLVGFIKNNVPGEILNDVFGPKHMMDITLDQKIIDVVINGRVLQDCNVLTGEEVNIDISASPRAVADNGVIFYVGFGPTQGRRISSVQSVSYCTDVYSGGPPGIVSALVHDQVMNSARAYLVGPNTVMVEGMNFLVYTYLRCMLEIDPNFDGISVRLQLLLAQMCVYATKAFIYNNIYLSIGTAVVTYGKDMARYNDIVSSYSDSAQLYMDMLNTKWRPAYVSTDRTTHSRLLRMMLCGA